jgi:hypothetical protein
VFVRKPESDADAMAASRWVSAVRGFVVRTGVEGTFPNRAMFLAGDGAGSSKDAIAAGDRTAAARSCMVVEGDCRVSTGLVPVPRIKASSEGTTLESLSTLLDPFAFPSLTGFTTFDPHSISRTSLSLRVNPRAYLVSLPSWTSTVGHRCSSRMR